MMIARAIELINPAERERGNTALRIELAAHYGVSKRLVDHIWAEVVKHRCPCCGHIRLPADYSVPAIWSEKRRRKQQQDQPAGDD